MSMFLHVMEEALQEWIVDARIIILHICMYRAGFLVQEICGERRKYYKIQELHEKYRYYSYGDLFFPLIYNKEIQNFPIQKHISSDRYDDSFTSYKHKCYYQMSFSISIEAEYLCCASKPNKAFTPIFKMEIFAILINKGKTQQ